MRVFHTGRNRRRAWAVWLCVGLLLGVACGGRPSAENPPTPTVTATPATPEAALDAAECPFAPPDGYTVACGSIRAPADHADPGRATLTLFVVVAQPQGLDSQARPADPLIYLDGGPGSYTVINAPFILEALQKVAGDRELVLFDQRGVGLSQPELNCPENEAALRAAYTTLLAPAEQNQAWLAAAATCHDRLAAEGIDHRWFSVTQSAQDVALLRQALGYPQVNLLGISYGTLLAQAVLALPDAHQWVRSVTLDSTLAPDMPAVTGNVRALRQALARVSANCAADPLCLARYGDVTELFGAAMQRLNDDPLHMAVLDPSTQEPLAVVVDGYRFRDIIFNMLYQRRTVARVPLAIERAGRGFGDELNDTLQLWLAIGAYSSEGMSAATACSFITPESPAALAAYNAAADPAFAVAEGSEHWMADVCRLLGVSADPQAGQLVTSPVPVLVLAGEYDPATPPEGARRVAETLGNATYLEFAGAAHNVLEAGGAVSDCARPIVAAFIAYPQGEIDHACVEAIKPLGFIVR